jgi:hypothetical protein
MDENIPLFFYRGGTTSWGKECFFQSGECYGRKERIVMEEIEKLTPKESVRAVCVNCLGMNQFNTEQVKECEGDHIGCTFFPYRMGKRVSVKTIRKYCIKDCMNGYQGLVAGCTTKDCANHPYRMGSNPARQGMGNAKNLRNSAREWGNADLKPVFSPRTI